MASSGMGSTAAQPSITWTRIARDGLIVVGVLWFVIGQFVVHYPIWLMVDALDYWSVNPTAPYAGAVLGGANMFSYSPPAAQFFVLVGHLPLAVYLAGWIALNLALAAWLVRPYPLAALILAQPLADVLLSGQIELVMTAAIVAGFRRPWLWPIAILTKVTPVVGLLWFALRREWRALAIAVGLTAAVVALSLLTVPAWWVDWLAFLKRSQDAPGFLPPRLVLATGLLIWGARTGRSWVVPAAAMLALPVVYMHSLAMLLGSVYLWATSRRQAQR